VKETWWIILTDKPKADQERADGKGPQRNIFAVEKISDLGREVRQALQFTAPRKADKYEMKVQLMSSCYFGLDVALDIKFEVFPKYLPRPEEL
jgi:hypothetical protein